MIESSIAFTNILLYVLFGLIGITIIGGIIFLVQSIIYMYKKLNYQKHIGMFSSFTTNELLDMRFSIIKNPAQFSGRFLGMLEEELNARKELDIK